MSARSLINDLKGKTKMKTKNRLIAVIMAVMMIIPLVSMVACSDGNGEVGEGVAYVAIDINPSVELVLDRNNRVVSVYAENEDAEVMLYKSEGIVGEKIAVAAENIAKLAEKYGYVTEDNKTVSVTVSVDGDKSAEDIYSDVRDSLAKGCGIVAANIENGANIMLSKRLEKLKAAYPDNADIQALDVAKYRLVRSAMAADRKLTVENAAKMTAEELTAVVAAKHEAVKDILSTAMSMAVESAEMIYGQTKANIVNTVYIKYGGTEAIKYMALDNAYFTIALLNKIKGDLAEFGITEAEVRAVAEKIGISTEKIDEFVADCKDSEGYVTDDTLEYAIEKWYRNMSADAKAAIDANLPELADEIDAFALRIKTVSDVTLGLVNAALAPLKLTTGFEIDFKIKTYDDIMLLADELRSAADESMAKMMAALSEEKKAELDNDIKALEGKISEAENVMRDAIEKAKQEAETFLDKAQKARLEAKG